MAIRASHYDNVISLGVGEPNFDTLPDISRQALNDAVRGATHYSPPKGDPELINILITLLNTRKGYNLSPQNIVLTCGAAGALTFFFHTLLDIGDEVLVPEPFFPGYQAQISIVGGKLVPIHARFENNYIPEIETIEKAITRKTKILLLNYPNNPTGTMINGHLLNEIARIAETYDLLIVSDEVYDNYLYDGIKFCSIYDIPDMRKRTVVINSFSKSFAMTGWRIGYAFGPEWIISNMTKFSNFYTGGPSSVSQRAALAAMQKNSTEFDEMYKKFADRKEIICKALDKIPSIEFNKPMGSFYIFVRISNIAKCSKEFAIDLLDREQVVTIPGTAFGESGEGYIRLSFGVNQESLIEAMKRFTRFVQI